MKTVFPQIEKPEGSGQNTAWNVFPEIQTVFPEIRNVFPQIEKPEGVQPRSWHERLLRRLKSWFLFEIHYCTTVY